MKHFYRVAPLVAALLLASASAFAQPDLSKSAAPTALAPLDEANWRAISIQNARPSLIAYMLDPAHNSLPASFNIPGSLASKFRTGDDELKKVPKGPFEGLRLVGADNQKLLFVSGKNEAQIAQLQAMVALLDKTERLVTVEAQLVELPVAEISKFGLAFDAATPGTPGVAAPVMGALQIGFVPDDFQTRLDELVKAGAAKVLSTGPQIITNNASLAVSLRFGPIDNTGANQNKLPPAPKAGTDTIITLTPTINGDDTITVLMNTATLPETNGSSGLASIFNLRDGQIIALTGLKSSAFPRETNAPPLPMLDKIPFMNSTTPSSLAELNQIPITGKLFHSKKLEDANTVLLLVTARLVRTNEK